MPFMQNILLQENQIQEALSNSKLRKSQYLTKVQKINITTNN